MTADFEAALNKPEPKRDRWGRYVIEGKAHVRATTIADTLDDRHNLEKWQQRMVASGLSARADLHALASTLDPDRDRAELNKVCEKAIEAAKSVDKAGLGTALHRMTETLDNGGDIERLPAQWHPHLHAYNQALVEAGIQIDREGVERIICHDTGGLLIAGTADRLPVIWHGRRYVADLKTGANLEWSWRSIAIQLSIYAHHTHVYDLATDKRHPRLEVETDQAMVIHLPAVVEGQIKPRCDIYMVDTRQGYDAFITALEVREWRSTKGLATPLNALHAEGTPAEAPAWFRQRGANIAANPDALAQLRRLWPATVPQPLPDVLTDAQAADLDTVMATVEANYKLAFPTIQPGTVKPKSITITNSKDKAA